MSANITKQYSCVCVSLVVWNGVCWCGLVPANCYRLACLSVAVPPHKETTVPNQEAQRWYGWSGEQQNLLPLLRTEPQIIQPVALLCTNNFHSARDQLFCSFMPNNVTINELFVITVTMFFTNQPLQLLTSTCFFLLALGFLSSTVPPGFRFRSSFFAASFFFLFSSYSEIRSGQSRFSSGSHVLSSLLDANEQSR